MTSPVACGIRSILIRASEPTSTETATQTASALASPPIGPAMKGLPMTTDTVATPTAPPTMRDMTAAPTAEAYWCGWAARVVAMEVPGASAPTPTPTPTLAASPHSVGPLCASATTQEPPHAVAPT